MPTWYVPEQISVVDLHCRAGFQSTLSQEGRQCLLRERESTFSLSAANWHQCKLLADFWIISFCFEELKLQSCETESFDSVPCASAVPCSHSEPSWLLPVCS